jgi:hypothetical protein
VADQFTAIENSARSEGTLAPAITLRRASHDLAEAISSLKAYTELS